MNDPRPASRLDSDPRDSEKLAYAAGRRDADVDATLRGHEKRLNAINGSIERHAREASRLGGLIESVDGKVDSIAARLERNAAVEGERNRLLSEANEKQISTKMFVVGVLGVCAVLIVGFATVYVMLHTAGAH